MFTGLIKATGIVKKVRYYKNGKILQIYGKLKQDIEFGESIAINGVCLTVTKIMGKTFETYVSSLSISKTNLSKLRAGHYVNIERALKFSDRLGGHLVQGHVDGTARVIAKKNSGSSTILSVEIIPDFSNDIVQNGSIAINGVSLTVSKKSPRHFDVTIIPYTLSHTTIGQLQPGDFVNIETDILGKYAKTQKKSEKLKTTMLGNPEGLEIP